MKRRPLVVGNWKMNGDRESAAERIRVVVQAAGSLEGVEVVVCVPFTLLETCRRELGESPVKLGAQDLSERSNGAHTGEVSAAMLRDFDCAYVIVGHSERRAGHRETDAVVAAKTQAALEAGLSPIVCVGETLHERESGKASTVVLAQVDAVFGHLRPEERPRCVLAYEPVWAIGTGRTATHTQANDMHAVIRTHLRRTDAATAEDVRILYGGSLKTSNANELLSQPDIDGGLIGGASLIAADFVEIVRAGHNSA
jgi:triosephosphate isomerase (TIM)